MLRNHDFKKFVFYKKCAMGRASARTPVPNAVYSTARASACFGGVQSVFIARLRRLQIPVLRGGCLAEEDPRTGARSSVLRSVIHWAGKVPVLAAGFPGHR